MNDDFRKKFSLCKNYNTATNNFLNFIPTWSNHYYKLGGLC